jgi:predicted regulator of Ras-like GTPase activity (Roadblock/LC7/MglB family)
MSDKDLLVELKRTLNDYLGTVSGTRSIFIATLDGHLLLERRRNKYPIDQISPMAGSVLGISETLSSQLLQQKLQDNIIIMEKNILGLLKIDDKEDSLFLGILCDRLVNLGKMITFGKLTIKEINQILDDQDFT